MSKSVVDQEGGRRVDLAKIHLAKKDLGWDDEFYRSILWSVCRVKSSADLDFTGRKRLLEHMRRCGWRGQRGARPRADDDQSKMIRGLWLELHELEYVTDSSEAALANWIKRETRVEALQWLSTAQKRQTIEKLKRWLDRDAAKLRPLASKAFELGLVPLAQLDEISKAWFGSPKLTKTVAAQMLARLQRETARG